MSEEMTIAVKGDVSGVLNSMQEMMESITSTMESIREAMKGGKKSAEEFAKGTILGADGVTVLAKSADSSKKKISETKKEIDSTKYALISFSGTITKTSQNWREKLGSFAEPFANITVAIHGARRALQLFAGAWAQASRFENVTVRLAPLVGGLETARRLADELRESAANGTAPFETLAASAGKLASVFKSAEAVRKWTDAFHNISAGLGRDVNELVENFVKSKASGRFEAGFLDMFAAKGVDIWAPVRAAHPDKTAAELRKMAVEGKIAFAEIEAVGVLPLDFGDEGGGGEVVRGGGVDVERGVDRRGVERELEGEGDGTVGVERLRVGLGGDDEQVVEPAGELEPEAELRDALGEGGVGEHAFERHGGSALEAERGDGAAEGRGIDLQDAVGVGLRVERFGHGRRLFLGVDV